MSKESADKKKNELAFTKVTVKTGVRAGESKFHTTAWFCTIAHTTAAACGPTRTA